MDHLYTSTQSSVKALHGVVCTRRIVTHRLKPCGTYACLGYPLAFNVPTLITALTVPQVGRDYSVPIYVPCAYAYNCAYSYKKLGYATRGVPYVSCSR